MSLEPARGRRGSRGGLGHAEPDAWSQWLTLPVALVGGAITSLGFPASDLAPLALIGVAAGLAAFAGAGTARRGAFAGFVYGLGFGGVVFSWTLDLEIIAYVGLVPAQAAFWAITGAVTARAAGRLGALGWTLAVAATWTLVEALRARQPLSGFEWGQLGLAAAELPVRPAAAVVGTLGVTGLLVALSAAVVAAVRHRELGLVRAGWPVVLVAAVTAGVTALGTQEWTEPTGELDVAIVQVDDPCPGEYAVDCPGLREQLLRGHLEGTADLASDPDLLLWGEGVLRGDTPEEVGTALVDAAGTLPAPLLSGVTSPVGDHSFYNRNVLFDPDGAVLDAYAKRHPVPFGEYVPLRPVLGWAGDVGRLVPTDMVRGAVPGHLTMPGSEGSLGSVVSWEVTFARLVRDTAMETNAVVTLTTQASYGEAPVSEQLLQAAQMRGAETGRSIAVAATTGRSTIIAPDGQRGPDTALFAADTLEHPMELRTGSTPFLRYGEWPVIAAAAALALASGAVARLRSEHLL